ncbi:MAG: DUF2029 domain-containing protein [Chitinophagales bacterium]|nr:DUF2029 domain-containing protein [Chitinophagales bacterium]
MVVYILLAIIISFQEFLLSKPGDRFTHYNNFIIFRQSFLHLIQNKDLYIAHPDVQYDLFKYSPAFAVFMGAFAYLPMLAGLILWNALNAAVLWFAIKSLPVKNKIVTVSIAWFVVIELITSMQNSQSNVLMAGLLILAFCFLERRNIALATLMICLTVFIKIFGLVAFSLFLLYPEKKKFILWSALWIVLLILLPLMVVSPAQLIFLYKSWYAMLSMDYSGSWGISVMGWLHTWFHFDPPKNVITLLGIAIFCLPLLFYKRFGEEIFRNLFLSSILIWVIIFNHKAESATFIIAVCGIAIWYFMQQRTTLNFILLLLAFIFTMLSPTDLFPPVVRNSFMVPYTMKVFPCILIWLKIIWEMMVASYKPRVMPG